MTQMKYKLSNRSLSRLVGIEQVLIDIIQAAISTSPYDFGIPMDGGYRTPERQNEMYQQGRQRAGKIITSCDGYKKKSRHQSGRAFDIYAYVDGSASWELKYLIPIGKHLVKTAEEGFGISLRWGLDWDQDGVLGFEDNDENFQDAPHFELG